MDEKFHRGSQSISKKGYRCKWI